MWTCTCSAPSDPTDYNIGDANTSRLNDLDFDIDPKNDISDEISRNIDEEGVHLPIKDGRETLSEDEQEVYSDGRAQKHHVQQNHVDDATSEDECELPGQRRPKRGMGWWGHGRPLRAQKKGLANDVGRLGGPGAGGEPSGGRRGPDHHVLLDGQPGERVSP